MPCSIGVSCMIKNIAHLPNSVTFKKTFELNLRVIHFCSDSKVRTGHKIYLISSRQGILVTRLYLMVLKKGEIPPPFNPLPPGEGRIGLFTEPSYLEWNNLLYVERVIIASALPEMRYFDQSQCMLKF